MRPNGRSNGGGERVAEWWRHVLAGESAAPHPVHGDRLKVHLAEGRLVLAGTLDSRRERDELVREARSRIGRGVKELDVSGLHFNKHPEKHGILEQTLLASYAHRDSAEGARKFVLEHSGVEPKHVEVVERYASRLNELAPAFAGVARKRLDRGETILAIRVDEVDAFKVRAILEEATHSVWTAATPPDLPARDRAA